MKKNCMPICIGLMLLLAFNFNSNATAINSENGAEKKEIRIERIINKVDNQNYDCYTLGVYVCGICLDFYMCGQWSEVLNNYDTIREILSYAECSE